VSTIVTLAERGGPRAVPVQIVPLFFEGRELSGVPDDRGIERPLGRARVCFHASS
jgi:hypothetical protein